MPRAEPAKRSTRKPAFMSFRPRARASSFIRSPKTQSPMFVSAGRIGKRYTSRPERRCSRSGWRLQVQDDEETGFGALRSNVDAGGRWAAVASEGHRV